MTLEEAEKIYNSRSPKWDRFCNIEKVHLEFYSRGEHEKNMAEMKKRKKKMWWQIGLWGELQAMYWGWWRWQFNLILWVLPFIMIACHCIAFGSIWQVFFWFPAMLIWMIMFGWHAITHATD